jgi:hypothetical protein
MTKFLRILKELQELVESEGKTLKLEFDPNGTQPDVYIRGEFVTGAPFTSSHSLISHFQQETESVEEANKLTLNKCMQFLKDTLTKSCAENLKVVLTDSMISPKLSTNLTPEDYIINPYWEEEVYEAAFKKPAPETIVVEGVIYRKVI